MECHRCEEHISPHDTFAFVLQRAESVSKLLAFYFTRGPLFFESTQRNIRVCLELCPEKWSAVLQAHGEGQTGSVFVCG